MFGSGTYTYRIWRFLPKLQPSYPPPRFFKQGGIPVPPGPRSDPGKQDGRGDPLGRIPLKPPREGRSRANRESQSYINIKSGRDRAAGTASGHSGCADRISGVLTSVRNESKFRDALKLKIRGRPDAGPLVLIPLEDVLWLRTSKCGSWHLVRLACAVSKGPCLLSQSRHGKHRTIIRCRDV